MEKALSPMCASGLREKQCRECGVITAFAHRGHGGAFGERQSRVWMLRTPSNSENMGKYLHFPSLFM